MRNNRNDIDKIENIANNLIIQVEKLRDHCNEKSFKTRYRYSEAVERLCHFLASEFRLQKFSNLKNTHIIRYVEHLKNDNISAATIKTDLSGIRFYHRLSGSKNNLVDNKNLNLEKRNIGQKDRAWSNNEIENALKISKSMGRLDIYYSIKLAANFGLRIEEVCKCTVNHLRYTLDDGQLYVRGKGGQERFVTVVRIEQLEVLQEILTYSENLNKSKTDKIFTDNIRGGTLSSKRKIQNWVSNHRNKFQDVSRYSSSSVNNNNNQKLQVQNISFHGLRYFFSQRSYSDLSNDPNRKQKISEMLGHHRSSITDIYLATKAKKK